MRYLIAIIGAVIIVLRSIFPKIIFDTTSLSIFIVIVFTLLFPELSKFLSKVKKIKAGEFELELDNLVKRAEEIEAKTEKIHPTNANEINQPSLIDLNQNQVNNPTTLLIEIAIKIEKVLNSLTNSLSITKSKIPFSRIQQIDLLTKENIIDRQISSIFKDFWQIRNKVIHGHNSNISDNEIFRIIDLGYKILDLLENEKNSITIKNGFEFENIVSEALTEIGVNFSSQQAGKDTGYDFHFVDKLNKNYLIEVKYWNYNIDRSVINQVARLVEIYKSDLILISNIELSNLAYEELQNIQKTLDNKIHIVIGNNKESIKSQLEIILK